MSDKLEHTLAYLVLAFLPALHERRNFLIGAAVGAVALGVLLEYGQAFAGRDFEIGDMAADAAGVALGLVCALFLRSLVMQSSDELQAVKSSQD
jgi:VanZ family protein